MKRINLLPVTPASPLLPGWFLISQSTCPSWLGNKSGCLFRNSSARQFFPETFQATIVKVSFSSNGWGLSDESTNSLGAYQHVQNLVEFVNMVLSKSLYLYGRLVFCLTPGGWSKMEEKHSSFLRSMELTSNP